MRVVNCSEPDRFQPAGYWASQGLETEEQVRWEMLWQAATVRHRRRQADVAHAEGCDYCGDMLDRFRPSELRHEAGPRRGIGDLSVRRRSSSIFSISSSPRRFPRNCRSCEKVRVLFRRAEMARQVRKAVGAPVDHDASGEDDHAGGPGGDSSIGAVISGTVKAAFLHSNPGSSRTAPDTGTWAGCPPLDRGDLIKPLHPLTGHPR